MSRRITNGRPEHLDPIVVQDFLSRHIPYRLEMLSLAEEVLPPSTTRDSAFVEAAIVSGRLLLDFLGLGITRRGGLRLVPAHHYRSEDCFTDDVKIPDVGGRFVDIATLDTAISAELAQFYNGASKASAHFTWDSGHQLDLDNLRRTIPTIRALVQTHLPARDDGT